MGSVLKLFLENLFHVRMAVWLADPVCGIDSSSLLVSGRQPDGGICLFERLFPGGFQALLCTRSCFFFTPGSVVFSFSRFPIQFIPGNSFWGLFIFRNAVIFFFWR